MIEQAMIFALGFLIASLLSLLMLPIVSRRAVRLATRRLQMLVPLSMDEIAANRDQIRAAHAVTARRLEQRIERLVGDKAKAMSEAGRFSVQLKTLNEEHARVLARAEVLQRNLEMTTLDAHEARATLGLEMQMLHDALGVGERRLAILRGIEARLAAAEALIDQQSGIIEGLEMRGTGHDLRMRALMAKNVTAARQFSDARTQIAAVTLDLGAARAEIAMLSGKRDELQADLDIARTSALDGERRFAAQAAQMAELASRLADQSHELVIVQDALVEAKRRVQALEQERDAKLENVAPLSDRVDDLAALRETIKTLAAEMLLMTHKVGSQEGVAPPLSSDPVASPQNTAPV
ncbi:hypothetical protein [Lichenihabitans psoromatis]|uniref:hypothetical protein n=1 Tax=Lichenihabitans psoromatis TaxID=2528642 RepID=UPI00103698F4|nr:hypothetical protein [Lichenihabitans psoromatis]